MRSAAMVTAAATITAGASQRPHPSSGVDSIRGSSSYNIYFSNILPDANAIGRRKIELLPGLHVEGRVPRIQVAHDVRTLLGGRMRVGQQPLAQVRFAIVAPPDLRPTKIEA